MQYRNVKTPIGIMRVIGVQDWQLMGMLLLENGLVGGLGGVLGVVISAGIVGWGGFLGPGGNLPITQILALVLLALAVTLVTTLLPAHRATQEKPLEVLRYE